MCHEIEIVNTLINGKRVNEQKENWQFEKQMEPKSWWPFHQIEFKYGGENPPPPPDPYTIGRGLCTVLVTFP